MSDEKVSIERGIARSLAAKKIKKVPKHDRVPIELAARCASEFLLWAGSSASDGKGNRYVDFSRHFQQIDWNFQQLEFELSNDTIDGLVVYGFMMIYLKPFPL